MKNKRIIATALVSALAAGVLAGCGGTEVIPIGYDTEMPSIEIMTTATRTTPAGPNSPVVQEIEKYLGEKMTEKYKDVYGKTYDKVHLDIGWVATSGYGEKVTATLGAEEYPQVMCVTTRNSSIIQNSKHGTFWDITDAYTKTDPKYVSEENPEGYVYPHLAQANKRTLKNISVDGRVYGIYRSRVIGRQGVVIRKDWLDKLGLDMPETVDDLEVVLDKFTNGDPDGNGKKDTYGMIITTFLEGPLRNLATWMGSPNGWGYDEEAQQWKPWFMSEGYFAALTKLREWYAKGYINKNMATLDANSWDEDFLNGVAGVQIDLAERASKNARNIAELDPDAVVGVFGYLKKDKDSEGRAWPTTGHNGYYVFPKAAVPTEQDLDFILSVLDECNSEYVVDLCNYGIEGIHYELDSAGRAIKYTEDQMKEKYPDGKYSQVDYTDLPQFSMGVMPTKLRTSYINPIESQLQGIWDDNEAHAVTNPMEPYTSESYSMSGTQLDAIEKEAEVNYITGRIDENGYRKAMEQWIKMDGDLVCSDYEEAYNADESNWDENGKPVIPDEFKAKFVF